MKPTSFKAIIIGLLTTTASLTATAGVVLFDGKNPVSYNLPSWKDRPVTEIVAEMLDSDLQSVTGLRPERKDIEDARIRIYNLQTADSRQLSQLRKAGIKVDDLRKHKDACICNHCVRLYFSRNITPEA